MCGEISKALHVKKITIEMFGYFISSKLTGKL